MKLVDKDADTLKAGGMGTNTQPVLQISDTR